MNYRGRLQYLRDNGHWPQPARSWFPLPMPLSALTGHYVTCECHSCTQARGPQHRERGNLFGGIGYAG